MEAEEIDGPEQDEEVTLSLDIKYGKDGRVRRAIGTVSPTSAGSWKEIQGSQAPSVTTN